MKKVLCLLALVVAICTVSSCSKSGGDLYDYISDRSSVLVSVDIMAVMQNAGFDMSSDGIEAPAYIKSMLTGSQRDKLRQLLDVKGIDPRCVILVYDADSEVKDGIYMMSRLTDAGSFAESIEDTDFVKTNEGGYEVFSKDNMRFVVDGDILLLIEVRDDPAYAVDELKKAAADNPLADWKIDKLNEGKTAVFMVKTADLISLLSGLSRNDPQDMGIDNLGDMMNGYMVYTAELEGLRLKMESYIYSDSGEHLDAPFSSGRMDKGMLRYSSPVDFMAMLLALPDDGGWKDSIIKVLHAEVGQSASAVESMLRLLDGKMMLSFGYDDVQHLMLSGSCHFACAIQAENGQGSALFGQIRMLLDEAEMPYIQEGDALEIPLGDGMPTIYFVQHGDNVVVSNGREPAAGGQCRIADSVFGDGYAGFAMQLPANSADITFLALPFGIEMSAQGHKEGGELTIRLTDTDGYFLENVFKVATSYL